MFNKVKWRRFKNYSGPMIRGKKKFLLSPTADHWERVVWLTAKVETGGKFGATNAYDGTGNTSGLIQGIAVYPKELAHEDNNPADDQGALWPMLEYIRLNHPDLTRRLEDEFLECGWVLKGGCVRVIEEDGSSGSPVNGRLLREELTPNQGKVPKSGEEWVQAKNWALMFHEIFNNEKSFAAQIQFGIEHAHKVAKRKPFFLRGKSISSLIYNNEIKDTKLFTVNDPMDLAMAILFSNAVNAPAMAFKKLKQAFDFYAGSENKRPNWQSPSDRLKFANLLVRILGHAEYGRWNFKIDTGRYQRTRKAAMKVWPKEFFTGKDAVMPKKL